MLTVYVDDFKLAGPEKNLKRGWELLDKVLTLEEAGPKGRQAGRYLGCDHIKKTMTLGGREVTTMTYDMEDYLRGIVNDYVELVSEILKRPYKCKTVSTPFVPEDHKKAPARAPSDVEPLDVVGQGVRVGVPG